MNRLSELVKANIQRSKIIKDQMVEARSQMHKLFDHKGKIVDIMNKYSSKRSVRKKEKSWIVDEPVHRFEVLRLCFFYLIYGLPAYCNAGNKLQFPLGMSRLRTILWAVPECSAVQSTCCASSGAILMSFIIVTAVHHSNIQ